MLLLRKLLFVMCSLSLTIFISSAYAEGCKNYPFSPGEVSFQDTPRGPKILATGAASVDFDDADEVLDAITEATMEAKASISKFFNEEIKSDQAIETASTKTIKIVKGTGPAQKTATKEKVKKTLKRLSNQSSALLRGVVKLAECYTKGKRVMVSVGLKPETIAAAEASTKLIDESVNRQPTATKRNVNSPTGETSGSSSGRTSGTNSYNKGLNKIKKF
jgi:hypothetical protein